MPPPLDEFDRAIIVGIANYPRFGLNGATSNDLQGPVKDAIAVADWLVNKANAHVTLITSTGRDGRPPSSSCPAAAWNVIDRRPNSQDVRDGLVSYIETALNQPISRLGRRLYIYMAGHGFTPEPLHLSIITADAVGDVSIPNVQATSWIDWFADQLYFDELVLWMDCCATRTFSYDGGKPLLRKVATRQNGRAKVFMAFAAGPSLPAFEGPVGPNGEIRGLFTDRLLRGLNGAAVGADGVVRTSDLVGFLRNRNAPGAEGDPGPSSLAAPVFPYTDEMELARAPLPVYVFRTTLPDGEILKINEYRGGAERQLSEAPVQGGTAQFALARGLYKAVSEHLGAKLFEIGAGTGSEVSLA